VPPPGPTTLGPTSDTLAGVDPTSPASAITTVLQGAGALGAAVLALGWVCIRLYNAYKEVQDKRVLDAREYAQGMNQAVQTIRENTETVNRIADLLDREGKR
jgi:hypothetical protein